MLKKIALGALVLAGSTAAIAAQNGLTRADRELADALKGRSAGAPVDCVSTTLLNGPQIIDKRTILYRETGKTVWRTDIEGGCPGLDRGDILIVELHGSQMCRNDMFRATEPGTRIPGPNCRFGKFTPYRK